MKIFVGKPEIPVKVFIPPDAKNIAILISGGSDSAVLLYMLSKVASKQNVKISTFTVPRADGAINYSPNIVDMVSKLSEISLPTPISVGNPNIHHSQQTRSGHREILENFEYIDYIYYASQKVPFELQNILGMKYPWRPDRISYPGKTICPFFNLTKEHTIDLYYKLNIVELLEYSHSCCVMPVGRCGKCYNCVERNWAFKKLNKIDPGSL